MNNTVPAARSAIAEALENSRQQNTMASNAMLVKAAKAALEYDQAINACANDPDAMATYCTAQGENLDMLYSNWISAAKEAMLNYAPPEVARPRTLHTACPAAATHDLTFSSLRRANLLRLPQFKNPHGELAHSKPDGSDWSPSQWLQAVVGELGEYANVRKKLERGDITLEQFSVLAAKELADVQIYLSLLAMRALDTPDLPHPHGIDLGEATRQKFNEVSCRVGSDVYIDSEGHILRTAVLATPSAQAGASGGEPT
jgi:hypothetical protein